MRTGDLLGAEALIRWQHPTRGRLLPDMFLPVIEDHPLIDRIGEWVIASALAQMESWLAAGLKIPVSVNIAAHHLQQKEFVEALRSLLAAHPKIPPGWVELEILESSALHDVAEVSHVLAACREMGVTIALDDFGTGYSSLTYFKRLPVSTLKIDRSFVCDILTDPEDLSILEGVLGLATAFDRMAIAEGVETIEHGRLLLQLGCTYGQGNGIALPWLERIFRRGPPPGLRIHRG
jgi:EAL domain-containing protein (putative c-di-GMP-specific phosphodiesterase class I)